MFGGPPLDAFRHREFRLFYIGVSFSSTAWAMQTFVLGWLAVELAKADGSPQRGPLYLGLASVSAFVPALFFGLVGSAVADRSDRGRILTVSRAVSATLAAVVAVLELSGAMRIQSLMAVSALSATSLAFDGPARLSIVPLLVPLRDTFTGLGLMRALTQASIVVGPLVGGLLLAAIDLAGVMVVTTALFIVSAFSVSRLRPLPPVPGNVSTKIVTALRLGLTYMGADQTIRSVLGAALVFSVCASSFTLLLPAVANDTLGVGPLELSWLASAAGGGAASGALIVNSTAIWRRPGRLLIGATLIFGITLIAFSTQRSLGPAIALTWLLGCLAMLFNGGAGNIMHILTMDAYRGRVLGFQSMLFLSGTQLGAFVFGSLGSVVGIATALGVAGFIVLVTGATMYRVRSIREAGERAPTTQAPIT